MREENKRKVAIVGVEGSGKTVLMVSWGRHYQSPDRNGYFLAPIGEQNTDGYIAQEMAKMRDGRWPMATPKDAEIRLDWRLGGTDDPIGKQLSFVDFGGELYREAFKDGPEATMKMPATTFLNPNVRAADETGVAKLRRHIRDCHALVILINLRDFINDPNRENERTREMFSVIFCLMEIMRLRGKQDRIALVFSQADSYREILKREGLSKAYSHYLEYIAGSYPRVALFAVSAVNKMRYVNGVPGPAEDFKPEGLEALTAWLAWQQTKVKGFELPDFSPNIVRVLNFLLQVFLIFTWVRLGIAWFRFVREQGRGSWSETPWSRFMSQFKTKVREWLD